MASSGSGSNDAQELAHLEAVLDSFASYLPYSLATNNVRRRSYNALPFRHRGLLDSLGAPLPLPALSSFNQPSSTATGAHGNPWGDHGIRARLFELDDRVRRNADFIERIIQEAAVLRPLIDHDVGEAHEPLQDHESSTQRAQRASHAGNPETPNQAPVVHGHGGSDSALHAHSHIAHQHSGSEDPPPPKDVDKVRSTLKQLVRDWSAEGSEERSQAYGPILEALESIYAHVNRSDRAAIRILFPGCGLGRLPWEAAYRGFSAQGNEFSLFMLMTSNLILNHTSHIGEHTIYPWVGSMSNWRQSGDVLQAIKIPDVDPNSLLGPELEVVPEFSMAAGDFVRVYSDPYQRSTWSAVCTAFFIDTARNVIEYLEVINHLLVIGGHWINLGPCLWHFEGSAPEQRELQDGSASGSIELTLEEVVDLVGKMGFRIEQRRTIPRQSYTGNRHSMLTYEYECEFWVATKVSDLHKE